MNSDMSLSEALRAVHAARQDEVVVTTMGTAREWMKFGPHPLDLVYVPASMGQATSVGLGLALAQPSRRVIVCNGDGSLLMNLGTLVTITAQRPRNLLVLLFDNGVYEVTGQQPTPGSDALRPAGSGIAWSAVARACGFDAVFEFRDLSDWKAAVSDVLSASGPVFVWLPVAPIDGDVSVTSPGPAGPRMERLRNALIC